MRTIADVCPWRGCFEGLSPGSVLQALQVLCVADDDDDDDDDSHTTT